MSFSSFYGGRQGAPFIIVKHFDVINADNTDNFTRFKVKYCAYTVKVINNQESEYFLRYDDSNKLIEKDESNYKQYYWKVVSCGIYDETQGKDVPNVVQAIKVSEKDLPNPTVSNITLEVELAEGMVQCFKQGGNTTDEVNYGEYVIIDTQAKNNPDNGKVYRRGINFDYNAETNPLAGAEYIGQIVGPKGSAPELRIDHYQEVTSRDPHIEATYTPEDGDMPPGSYIDETTGERVYNDNIYYAYADIINEVGETTGAVIGFKFPTLIQDYDAQSQSPYINRAGSGTSEDPYYNYDLITEDPEQYVDGQWLHPFYQKWQVKVPHGYHGINSTDIEVVHTKTMPAGHKSSSYTGTPVYTNAACTVPYNVGGSQLVLVTSTNVLRETPGYSYNPTEQANLPIYDASDSVISCKINYNNQELYVKKEDCYKDVARYKETNYDNYEVGEVTYFDIDIKYVDDVQIQTNDPNTSGSLEGSGDQKVYVTYSTDENNPMPIGQPLNYVLDTYVVPISNTSGYAGHLLVYYSDPERRAISPIEHLSFPSTRLGQNVTGWTDLGDIKGITQTPLSFAEYATFADIPNAAPEVIMGTSSNPNYRYAGWGATYTKGGSKWIAQYDYISGEWKEGVPFGEGITSPEMVIAYGPNPISLWENGFRVDNTNRTVADEILTSGVTYQLSRKISDGHGDYTYDSRPIGPELRYVGAQRNSNTHNLEEQLILGTDKEVNITETVSNSVLTKVEQIDYKVDGSTDSNYTLEKTTIMEPVVDFDTNENKLILNFNPKITSEVTTLSYNNSNIASKTNTYDYTTSHTTVIKEAIS